jgi:hypothetical protein
MPMWKFLSRKRLLLQAMNILHETDAQVAHTSLNWTGHIPSADTGVQSALHQSTPCLSIIVRRICCASGVWHASTARIEVGILTHMAMAAMQYRMAEMSASLAEYSA